MVPPEPALAASRRPAVASLPTLTRHEVGRSLPRERRHHPRRTSYETGVRGHHTWRGGGVTQDLEIHDERFLAAHVRGRGTTVLTACSHAGVVNVGLEVRRLVPDARSMSSWAASTFAGTAR